MLLNLKNRSDVGETDTDEPIDDQKRLGEYRPLSEVGDIPGQRDERGSSSSLKDLDSDQGSSYGDQYVSLHQAASDGSIDQIKLMKTSMGDERFNSQLEEYNAQGFKPLHLAARYNRKNVVTFLLEVGAQINDPDGEDENTALLLATKYNMKSSARLLIEKGACATIKNKYGTTALHFTARRGNEELCKLLTNMPDVNINATDNGQATPLHMAMLGGSEEVTKLLINKGADVNAVDIEGERPIHFAAAEDAGDLIVILAKGALKSIPLEEREKVQREFVNAQSYELDTALHVASQAGYAETVKTLVTVGANVNLKTDTKQTPLHLAAISGQASVVRFLVLSNAKINALDEEQMTPLHRACQYGRLETIKFLRERGAKLDVRDKDNFTPLMCAVWKGKNAVVEYLLEEGANIELTEINNKCVLHLAIEEKHYETLDLLLKKGGTKLIDSTDKDYKTPFHYAASNGDEKAVELLLNNNAVVDVGDHEEKTPLHNAAESGQLGCVLSIGKAEPGMINSTDDRGRSPLHLSAMNGHIYATESLIEMGAETSCRDDVNWTPLDYAARNDFPKTMKVLLDNDAPVDAFDKNDTSPLHHASSQGNVNCVKLLLDYGASILLRNKNGKNCLDLAVEKYEREVCKTIISHKRWLEVFRSSDNDGIHPMNKLIEVAPQVALMVLDKCVEYPKNVPKDSEEYWESYNFELLDLQPDRPEEYFGPATMVLYQRDELLAHPLTVKLINDKWRRMGRWLYISSLTIYLLFVSLLTSLVVLEKTNQKDNRGNSTGTIYNPLKCTNLSSFTDVVPWLTIGVAVFQIVKEILQAIYLGRKYLFDPINWFEFLLYLATFLFTLPFILCKFQDEVSQGVEDLKWQAGSVSILFAWFNLLLYLKRFPVFGLYVVMFTEIFMTLVNVLLVFSILIIAFSLSFYSLVDVQLDFESPGPAFVRTSVMMIGELDYDNMFTDNFVPWQNASCSTTPGKQCLPYKGMTVFVFIAFLVIMSIIVMNLLVGLAVGDIESVRKNAYLRILKSQVRIIQILERTYPKFLLRWVYKDSLYIKPSERPWHGRFAEWIEKLDTEALKDEQVEMGGTEEKMIREISAQTKELAKQKEKMKSLINMIEEHSVRTKQIAKKLEIHDDDI